MTRKIVWTQGAVVGGCAVCPAGSGRRMRRCPGVLHGPLHPKSAIGRSCYKKRARPPLPECYAEIDRDQPLSGGNESEFK